jgi:hypothetical protein
MVSSQHNLEEFYNTIFLNESVIHLDLVIVLLQRDHILVFYRDRS